jgi:hypothetical protein
MVTRSRVNSPEHELPGANQLWKLIGSQARSRNEFERVGALATAAGALELAFTASGFDFRARRKIKLSDKSPDFPTDEALETAIVARHQAVHRLSIPRPDECIQHVAVLYKGWSAFRRRFVTLDNAAKLAIEFLRTPHISGVMLFGSLARDYPHPADIDFLLFDDGELSSIWSDYGVLGVGSLLEAAQLSTKRNRAAEFLRWLDLVVVDGGLFGSNPGYTATAIAMQRDPLFFLNVADGLLMFDESTHTWTKSVPDFFRRLAVLRNQLDEVGLPRSSFVRVRPVPNFGLPQLALLRRNKK